MSWQPKWEATVDIEAEVRYTEHLRCEDDDDDDDDDDDVGDDVITAI